MTSVLQLLNEVLKNLLGTLIILLLFLVFLFNQGLELCIFADLSLTSAYNCRSKFAN
jgi:hypothetical protein